MIEVTLNDTFNSSNAMAYLAKQEMSAACAFKIMRLIREIETNNRDAMDIINKLEEDKGNPEDLRAQIEGMMKTKVILNCDKIAFEDISEVKLTPTQANALAPFVE